MTPRPARPDYVSRNDVALTDDWGSTYRLDRIDAVSIQVTSNPAQIRFAPDEGGMARDWRDPIDLEAGAWIDISEGVLQGFSFFQLKRQTAGSASTVDFIAFCKGG